LRKKEKNRLRRLEMAGKSNTTGKRTSQQAGNKHRSKRRKYEVLDDNWGLGTGLSIEEIEFQETAKTRFLMSGHGHCKVGEGASQSVIRFWSANELWARSLALELLEDAWSRLL
jgi:hypothetical protein